VVIVTGASRGIGRATAREFARSGARVVLAARSVGALEGVRDEIRAGGGEAIAVEADVRDQGQVRGLVRQALDTWGRIDVLVNNAGVTHEGPLVEMTTDELREMIEVNLVGTIACTREVLPHFIASRRGHVVNVSSVLGKRGVPRQAVYAASKAAVLGLSEALRSELAPHGVTVTTICPSSTDTDMNRLVSANDHPAKQFVRKLFMSTPEAVARRIVGATRRREREVVLSLPGRAVVVANKIVPGVLDWLFARLERGRGEAPPRARVAV
jgi:short-subunit dehydrogenase